VLSSLRTCFIACGWLAVDKSSKDMLKTIVAVLLPLHLIAADAVMFQADAAHSGVYASTTSPDLTGVKWKFKTNGKVISSAAVVDGTAYFGSTDRKLYAVDSSSGGLRWTFAAGAPVNSSPLVAGGLVYFVSVDGNFYALDAASGKLAWKFQTRGDRRGPGFF
jgi:outer membrane protein assembly factor BamB